MQCCGQILQDSFETYNTFSRCIITEFEFQTFKIMNLSGYDSESAFLLLNNDDKKCLERIVVELWIKR